MRTMIQTLLFLSITALLGACATSSGADLQGDMWVLSSLDGNNVLADSQTTIQFDNGKAAGVAGCNRYNGSYEVNGDEISFGVIAQTRMACMNPEGIMQQESTFLKILEASERFELADSRLTIISNLGQELIFEPEGQE